MSGIPTISVTEEHFSDDVAEEATETIGLNINDAHTDVENLDSDGESQPCRRKSCNLGVKKAKCDALTDVEDMNDSGSDCEEAKTSGDIEISLEEFLDQSYVEEATKFSGHKQHMSDAPPKYPKLSKNLGVDVDERDALTDCENINASDEEEESEKFEDDDKAIVLEEANTVESHDLVKNESGSFVQTPIHLTTTGESTSSSEETQNEGRYMKMSQRKVCRSKHDGPPVSDIENIMFSDDEIQKRKCKLRRIPLNLDGWEEVTIQFSGDEDESVKTPMLPEIDITFARDSVKDKNLKDKKSCMLKVDEVEDGQTDVENLNSSDDDDDDSGVSSTKRSLIPSAIAKSKTGFITDTEDVDEVESDIDDTPEISLPASTRELVQVREDRVRKQIIKPSCGESLGIISGYIDKGLTDIEDLSDDEDSSIQESSKYTIEKAPDLDSGNTYVAEKLTTASNLAICSQIQEPLTDTEEIYQTGPTSRRRKHKHRCSGRGKPKLLEIKNQNLGGTDVEELDLSDTEGVKCPEGRKQKKRTSIAVPVIVSNEGATDVEYVSADDYPQYESCIPNMDASSLAGHTFASTITDTIGGPNGRKKIAHVPVIRKASLVPVGVCCAHTDTEDVGMPSDQEDDDYSRAQTATPFEVHQALEDASFTIHDRSLNTFDVQTEKLNIKGHRDCQEAYTDVEYVEDEARRE